MLIQAVRDRSKKRVKSALKKAHDDEVIEAFRIACGLGDEALVAVLVPAVKARGSGHLRVGLVPAVQGAHLNVVRTLVALNVDHVENAPTPEGEAARMGNMELLKALEGRSATWNPKYTAEAPQDWWRHTATAADGYTPLMDTRRC
jgi:hypothetical protein